MFEIDVTDLDAAFAKLDASFDRHIRDALEAGAVDITNHATTVRGINGGWKDRSGHLASSIRPGEVLGSPERGYAIDILGGGLEGVHYAPYIHWGTKRGIRPRLFLTVALEAERDGILERVARALKLAVKEAGL